MEKQVENKTVIWWFGLVYEWENQNNAKEKQQSYEARIGKDVVSTRIWGEGNTNGVEANANEYVGALR